MVTEENRKKVLDRLEQIKTVDAFVYAVNFKGNRLKMGSGKSSWASIGAAKNALRIQIPSISGGKHLEILKELEAEGIIEYIKL
jgi:hypothetical protein|nr:MAG TPA: CPT (Cm) phosphotransferase (CPT) [Caudoviricetes sp.]